MSSMTRVSLCVSVLLLAACRTTSSDLAGATVDACSDEKPSTKNFALVSDAVDFSPEAAVETVKGRIAQDLGIPDPLLAKIPIEVAHSCANDDEKSLTFWVGINLKKIRDRADDIKSRASTALSGAGSEASRFKAVMIVSQEIGEHNKIIDLLTKGGVKVNAIATTGVIANFKKAREKFRVALKFSDKSYVLQSGNVTSTVFKRAFVAIGLRPIESEKAEGIPDITFAIDIRTEELPSSGNSGQKFLRLYATVSMEDSNAATLAAATLEAKGGGPDQDAAMITALRSLEDSIVNDLFTSLFKDTAHD